MQARIKQWPINLLSEASLDGRLLNENDLLQVLPDARFNLFNE